MDLTRTRMLDRLSLILAGAVSLSLALHWGAALGLRPWTSGTAVPAARAAGYAGSGPATPPAAGCRDPRPGPPR